MKVRLGDIANKLNLELRGDPDIEIDGLANLRDALPGQLTFLFNASYKKFLGETKASAVVLRETDAESSSMPVLIAEHPRMAWAVIAGLFDPAPRPDGQRHESAIVHESAKLGKNVSLGPNVVVESGARIGDDVSLGAGCYVGEGSGIGSGSRLYPNVTLYHGVTVGEGALIHSGTVLGADGFGFEFDGSSGTMVKIPQVYGVRIGNNVEIGAGCTIDRGALNHTVIGDGVKLDNQVQVGHGTTIGANTVISGCTAIAGSTKIGSYCLIGGAVGIIDNIEIADQVEITAMTLVSQSIPQKGRYSSGTGLMPGREWKRSIVGFSRLDELIKRIRRLESANRADEE